MMRTKKYQLFLLLMIMTALCTTISGQAKLTLQEAYEMARENYPLLKTLDIYSALEQKENILIDQARKPTLVLKSEASLQSEGLSIGNELAPIFIEVPIYKVKAYGEVNYNLYDGGLTDIKKTINQLNTIIQKQQTEVSLYPLKEQINKIFSGVALGHAFLEIVDISASDIAHRKEVLTAGVAYGTILQSELTKLKVRLLELENERLKIASDIRSSYALLSVIIGKDISPTTELVISPELLVQTNNHNRPEYKLFDQQKASISAQKDILDIMNKPKIILFGQAGLAYPNTLNFSDISLSPFAIGGVKASYYLFSGSSTNLTKQKIDLQTNLVDVQKETFDHNLAIQGARYEEETKLLSDQILKYQEIAKLQSEILSQLKEQLDNGVITATEYLLQSNDELRAKQNVKITEAKLIQKQLEHQTLYGMNNEEINSKN